MSAWPQGPVGQVQGRSRAKPTGFVSNCRHLLNKLAKRCKGSGGLCSDGRQHATCSSTTARDAQVYGRRLCKAMLEGMQAQLKELGMLQSGILGIQAAAAEWEADELLAADRPREGFSGKFRDDLTGQILNDALVAAARAKELEYFAKTQVWQKVDKVATRRAGHNIVSVRWVDVNKGDNVSPNYRSRLVARQLKAHDKSGTVFFSPTPPL